MDNDESSFRTSGLFWLDHDLVVEDSLVLSGDDPFPGWFDPGVRLAQSAAPNKSLSQLDAAARRVRESEKTVEVTDLTPTGKPVRFTLCPFGSIDDTKKADDQRIRVFWKEVDERIECLEAVLDFVDIAWWQWDLASDTLRVFTHGDCLLGYSAGDMSATGNFWIEQLHRDDRERVLESLAGFTSGRARFWESEHRLARADTESRTYEWVEQKAKVVSWDERGMPLKAVGLCRNIHRRKLVESEFIEANRHLIEALNDRSNFLTAMNHEIRTPLNAVSGIAQLLSAEASDGVVAFSESDRRALIHACQALSAAVENAAEFCETLDRSTETLITTESLLRVIKDVLKVCGLRNESEAAVFGLDARAADAPIAVDVGLIKLALKSLFEAVRTRPLLEVRLEREDGPPGGYLHMYFTFASPVQSANLTGDVGDGPEAKVEAVSDAPDRVEPAVAFGPGMEICREVARLLGGWVDVSTSGGERITMEFSISTGFESPDPSRARVDNESNL